MLNFKKILSVIICAVFILLSFTGCGKNHLDEYIYFEVLQQPKTLDPQTASSDSEVLIVRNVFEGLLRKDYSGNIVNGACKDYTYSNLTYTFTLRDDLVWSDGTPLTADDFVFGFRRAVDPKIKAPFASRLFAIANAEAVANGSADVSALGVTALDEKTLQITMCREDAQFTDTLTTSVCMPCNEEFFINSIGKYGLGPEYVISNGSYRLTKWNKEDFGIRIYKNEKYSGNFEAQNAAVFISCIDDETQVLRLADGDSDMAFLPCTEIDEATDANLVVQNIENICWVMTVNRSFNFEIRRAFAMAFSNDIYSSALPKGFASAKSIYPDILHLNTDGIGITPYNINEAKSVMSSQISNMNDKKFPQTTLYYYETDGVKNLATAIVGHWQQNLSTFVNIEPSANLEVMQTEIGESTLDFALFPIIADSGSFSEYAENFAAVSTAATPEALQQELLENNTMIPVAYQNTNIGYIPTLESVVVEEDNGYIDFSFIIKR